MCSGAKAIDTDRLMARALDGADFRRLARARDRLIALHDALTETERPICGVCGATENDDRHQDKPHVWVDEWPSQSALKLILADVELALYGQSLLPTEPAPARRVEVRASTPVGEVHIPVAELRDASDEGGFVFVGEEGARLAEEIRAAVATLPQHNLDERRALGRVTR